MKRVVTLMYIVGLLAITSSCGTAVVNESQFNSTTFVDSDTTVSSTNSIHKAAAAIVQWSAADWSNLDDRTRDQAMGVLISSIYQAMHELSNEEYIEALRNDSSVRYEILSIVPNIIDGLDSYFLKGEIEVDGNRVPINKNNIYDYLVTYYSYAEMENVGKFSIWQNYIDTVVPASIPNKATLASTETNEGQGAVVLHDSSNEDAPFETEVDAQGSVLEEQPQTSPNSNGSSSVRNLDFIFVDSDARYLDESDYLWIVQNYSDPLQILGYARNEIYARHGNQFDKPKYQDWFNGKSWYTPTHKVSDNELNQYEKTNVQTILEWERRLTP